MNYDNERIFSQMKIGNRPLESRRLIATVQTFHVEIVICFFANQPVTNLRYFGFWFGSLCQDVDIDKNQQNLANFWQTSPSPGFASSASAAAKAGRHLKLPLPPAVFTIASISSQPFSI